MSETLVAAIIAAAATVSASLLQLKAAFAKEVAARTSGSSRRKGKMPLLLIFILLLAAAGGGFALAQWLHEDERVEQSELRRELEARINELGRAAEQLEATRNAARAEVENGVLRRMGEEGVTAFGTVGACKPASLAGASVTAAGSPASCTETEATPVAVCATVPAQAKVTSIELFARPADATGDWSANRAAAGHEAERARFSDAAVEAADADGKTKQVCHTFVHWGSDRARAVRMLVRYDLPPV